MSRAGLPAARCPASHEEHCLSKAHSAFAENRFAEALHHYQEAVRLGADPLSCAHQRWVCFMKLGEFELAWQETDKTEAHRGVHPQPADLPVHLQRVWDGSPIGGRRVLVRCFHGLGDTIQFIRYIPRLNKLAVSVTVQAQSSLLPLFAAFRRLARIVPADVPLDYGEFDIQVELMELPYIFRTGLNSVPATVPYLNVSPDLYYSRWLELIRLGLRSQGLSVGLAWSSGDWNPQRNIELSSFSCLGDIPGITFFSLQRGPAMNDIERVAGDLHIVSTELESSTVLGTAAAILNLDLIISVDTMVAHLAGALAKPTWTLLPFCSDWRWMAERNDSPWYPTMRLFRQPRPNDWQMVVDNVRAALLALMTTAASAGDNSFMKDQTSWGSSRAFSISP